MLKHVSSSQLSPYKGHVPHGSSGGSVSGSSSGKLLGGSGGSISGTLSSRQDSVSLASFGSSGGHEALSSRSSSTSSIHEMHHIMHNSHPNQHKLRLNPTLSPHIIINRNERVVVKVVVKIYARVLCADMEYKTLSISQGTSSREVIKLLLNKFRMKHRDPNLFYLTMEVWVKKTGMPIRTIMVLDDESRPAELQACHPRGDSKFCLQMRRGGLVKIYDGCLMQGSLYKSLLVSDRTTVEELIQLLLHCYNSQEWAAKFSLFEVSTTQKYERRLHHRDYPLLVQQAWPNPQQFVFQLRRNNAESTQKRRPLWLRSLDLEGQISFRLCVRDEVCPSAIHSPTLKPQFNNYENYFYI